MASAQLFFINKPSVVVAIPLLKVYRTIRLDYVRIWYKFVLEGNTESITPIMNA